MSDKRPTDGRLADRREFLKTSTIAAAGTALVANLGALANVHAAGSDEIRVGLIGCGGRGSGAVDNVMHAAPNVRVVAIGDAFKYRIDDLRNRLKNLPQEEEVRKLGNKVDLPEDRCFFGLDAYEKVLATDANYIILATPPGFRPPFLQAAVAAGKNIFAEKPVGVDGPGITRVLAAYEEAVKKGLHIGTGTQRRHQADYVETIKRIHDGEIGEITSLRAYWNDQGIWFRTREDLAQHGIKVTDLAFQLNNWYHFVWTCGDHICEQHVHNLDVCNWVMGKHPVRCVGMGSRSARRQGDPSEVGNIFDQFAIDYEYDNGVHMQSMCRQIANTESNVSEAIVGTRGRSNGSSIHGKRGSKGGIDPYVQEHTDLIASIRSGQPYNELKNTAESTLTAIMGRMSAYTGKMVTWEKALNSKLNTMPESLSWDMSLPVAPVSVPGKTPLV